MKKNLLTILASLSIIVVMSGFFPSAKKVSDADSQVKSHIYFHSAADCPSTPVTDTTLRIIHVYVSLADNDSQGIIPLPRKMGNGNDAANNLFWGGKYGVKTFFNQSDDWELLDSAKNISGDVLQRCVWKHRRFNCYMVADAYKGARIRTCTMNFLLNASGHPSDTAYAHKNGKSKMLLMEAAALICYVGHDGFMDFEIPNPPPQNSADRKDVFILASASRLYFKDAVLTAGAVPVLWTSNLITPEAYSLKAGIDGWLYHETGGEIAVRAAKAYDAYQQCGYETALQLFVTGYY